jgi:hypothetical protein
MSIYFVGYFDKIKSFVFFYASASKSPVGLPGNKSDFFRIIAPIGTTSRSRTSITPATRVTPLFNSFPGPILFISPQKPNSSGVFNKLRLFLSLLPFSWRIPAIRLSFYLNTSRFACRKTLWQHAPTMFLVKYSVPLSP